MFNCQKCRRVLKVNNAPLHEPLANAFLTKDPMPPHLTPAYLEKERAAIDQLRDSFVLVPSGRVVNPNQSSDLDRRVTALTNIMEVASDKSQQDQPICLDCTHAIVQELDRRLKEFEKERNLFVTSLEGLKAKEQQQQQQMLQEQAATAEREAEEEKEIAALEEKLKQIKAERKTLQTESRVLLNDIKQLEKLERNYWLDLQDYQLQHDQLSEELKSVKQRITVAQHTLQALKRTNVYDDAFHISYDGHFGTINGFRLGKLDTLTVEWPETNAALGQVVLLLHTLAKKHNFHFSKYKPVPLGSFSRMAKTDDPSSTCELFGSGDISFGRVFWYGRFDQALERLLYCLKELSDFATSVDKEFKLKYLIKGDLIGGSSIKHQFNQGSKWTKALKYMLTDLKYLLAWAAKKMD